MDGIWFSDVGSDSSMGSLNDEDGGNKGNKMKWFNERDMENPVLEVGMMFISRLEFRQALVNWNLAGGYDIDYLMNERKKITAICAKAHPDNLRSIRFRKAQEAAVAASQSQAHSTAESESQ